jgi:penicillin amidase
VDSQYPEWHAATESPEVPAGVPVEGLRASLELLRDSLGLGGASNNWALQGHKTAGGNPLVANDPHLAPILPPHWYLAHLSTPQWGLAGAAFAGTPAFMSAHNGRVAWGITAGLVDNTDLFIEEIGPGDTVQRGDEFVECRVLDELIEVKGGTPVSERVLITPLGPIVGPALAGEREAISMAATWLAPQRAGTLTGLGRVETVAALREELSGFSGPSLNFAAADDSGSILWQLAGEAPVRKAGRGALPLPAWLDGVGWEEAYVPFEDMPWQVDPGSGYVASANTRPSAAEHPFLGVDWIEGYRLARIVDIIGSRDDWDVPSTLQAQLDTKTLAWPDLEPAILATPHTDKTNIARSLLEGFDGDLSADSPAAAVFVLWLTSMQRRVAEIAAPNSVDAALGRGFAPAALVTHSMFAFSRTSHLVRLLRDRPEGWFDDWNDPITEALAEAQHTLSERLGPDPDRWSWGAARPLVLAHAIGARKPMDRIFNLGPIPWSGDFTTVAQSGAPPLEPLGSPSAVPSLRMAVEIGAWEDARFSLPGGQSGNPLSPHYDDQLAPWIAGSGVPIAWSTKAVERATRHTLHLVPA